MSELVYILNGPNLNLLGQREPEVYGHDTLEDIGAACKAAADALGLGLRFLQSNHEGQMVDWIQEARNDAAGIVINPAAFTHYSIAVMDALMAFDGPVIEVHISALHKREAFRQTSYVSHRADAVLSGFGVHGYVLAVRHMAHLLNAG